MRRALVTGATGFVGGHICNALLNAGYAVTAATRRTKALQINPDAKIVNVGEIGPDTDWRPALDGVEIVIHAAARTHVLRDRKGISENAYRRINQEATAALGYQAAISGVERFIFLSSVKAGGERSLLGFPLSVDQAPAPDDFYGRTKLAAEKALLEVSCKQKMGVVVLRAPLIYGPWLKGNLLSLFNAVNRGIILPLKAVENQRDMIYVMNLVDAILKSLQVSVHGCHTYYVCDGESVSTAELIRRIASALERTPRLFSCPLHLLRLMGWMTGNSQSVNRLTDTLQVDGQSFCQDLEWSAPFSMKEGLACTAAWYKSQR